MEITINNVQQKTDLPEGFEQLLSRCVEEVCLMEGISETCEVGVIIMDDEGIRLLNRDYRGIDNSTDVLSFSVVERGQGEPEIVLFGGEAEALVLGDIIISAESAKRQAEEYGHSFNRELGFLAVHGMLHLLGYDHKEAAADTAMRKKQNTILAKLQLNR